MAHSWPRASRFSTMTLSVLDRACLYCDQFTYVQDYKQRRLYTLERPLRVVSQMTICNDTGCAGHHDLMTAEEETLLSPPHWILAWDVFAHLGQARFGRHQSVPEIREELCECYNIDLSEDCIEDYIGRYQAMVAARQRDLSLLKAEYRSVRGIVLSIDGLEPEKGHETLYTVRDLTRKRVWFAEALLSSSHDELKKLFLRAKAMAGDVGVAIRGWVSDKQDGFVTGVSEIFPELPHRYCQNHFLRGLAKPVMEVDSHAKVQMRRKVRGLRAIEKDILKRADQTTKANTDAASRDKSVLGYCAAVRGILNKNQGGPLDPPGLRMAEGLKEVRASIERSIDADVGGEAERSLKRLGNCIDRGLAEVAGDLKKIPGYVATLRIVYDAMDPATGSAKQRQSRFQDICDEVRHSIDPIRVKMAEMMTAWKPGLFAGGERFKRVQDNLDLERWFRLPKAHERKIHGRQHAGVRIVQEGPSLILTLDAHHSHKRPFTEEELRPYIGAKPTLDELQAVERRKIMRRAASRKGRVGLLNDLEDDYVNPNSDEHEDAK